MFFLFFDQIITLVTDYQWFNELGYEEVMVKRLMTQVQLAGPIFLVSSLFFYLYFQSLKRGYYKKIQSYHMGLPEKFLNRIILLPSLFLGFILSSSVAGRLWFDFLIFRSSQSFNFTDPIFNKDISFYMFQLPVLRQVLGISTGLIFLLLILTFIFYIIMFIVRRPTLYEVDGRFVVGHEFWKSVFHMALKQLMVVGVVFFIVLTIQYYLRAYNVLYNQGVDRGVIFGASYTDIMVDLKVLRVQMIASGLAAIGLIVAYFRKNVKLAVAGPIALVVISLVGGVIGASVENFLVAPNQRAKQLPFIEDNIAYTRKAYGLENVTTKDFDIKEDHLTAEDIQNNRETIDNIRINDYRPTLEAYNNIQAIRSYYRFNDVDIDRYYINGKYTQVFLSGRELDINRLNPNAQNWINQHLKYTHGYGVTLSPVNKVTSNGLPSLAIKNIPPISDIDIEITRPEIYFGEITNQYIIVKTEEKEFDYPVGNDNAETIYEGEAGISLKGINKLLYSYKQGTIKLLLSGGITADSRIVLNRNILERVEKIAPFIEYDEDPYLVIHEGKLYWMIDGYTLSSDYPYSTPFRKDGVNYIRNSVKVVIDAYNGDVDYYISDATDPIINTYANVFPKLFKPLEEMPEGLKGHIRYPQDLFDLQSRVFAMYHMTNPNVFYNQEDLWYLAKEKYYEEEQTVESQYMIMKLLEESQGEYVLTIPYTPKDLPNLTALLVARNDGEHYGELMVYKLPKERNIYGPAQIESRIDQDTVISQDLSLWGEGGSGVIRGNLLVIPIEDSLLYVEPLYIEASGDNSIPEVKKVIVAYQDQIVMEDTLDLALERIFGGKGDVQVPPEIGDGLGEDLEISESLQEIIQKATDVFEKAKVASQKGDWATYGKYLEELEGLLNKLNNESSSQIEE